MTVGSITPASLPDVGLQRQFKARKRMIMIGVIVMLVAFLGIGLGWFWWLHSASKSAVSIPPHQLPGSSNQPPESVAVVSSEPSMSPLPVVNLPISPQALPLFHPAQPQNNLAIIINFNRVPSPRLEIAAIERTLLPSTLDQYAPNDSTEPYAVLRIFNQQQLLTEASVAIATYVIGEAADGTSAEVVLDDSVSYVVVPLSSAAMRPTRVELRGASGQLLDQREFNYEQLPRQINL